MVTLFVPSTCITFLCADTKPLCICFPLWGHAGLSLEYAMLHVGLETEIFSFLDILTTLILNCSSFFMLCLALTKQ